jgi:hypothetical protein
LHAVDDLVIVARLLRAELIARLPDDLEGLAREERRQVRVLCVVGYGLASEGRHVCEDRDVADEAREVELA